ncbi:hypothetical protein [Actinomadura algeriensis]|uniref:PH (Pleckstrin Homology) domain-containing protein n=1 Tax=Actinomadura algeriensis TaxID=1679523 RepID=A0ABR9JI89_9ACTN|nr:hypothetical protein [Actinomadura algeriensis]MBE1530261.1 hypothetical protein [Actinomadura algeriensis]
MSGDAPAPGEPVTVDVADAQARQIVVGAAVAGFFGVVALVAAGTGNVTGGTGARVAAFALGAIFTLIGVLPLLMWRVAFRARSLVLDADGMRWDDPGGAPWTVRWAELAGVELVNPEPDAGTPKVAPPVRLVLTPASPDFRAAHPEMEHLAAETPAGPGVVYRLPFGRAHRVVGPIDEGLGSFASGLYRSRIGRNPVPRRPPAVAASVTLLALCWLAAVTSAVLRDDVDGRTLAMLAFWTAAFTVWLVRVWLGGPLAIGQMARFAPTLGAVLFLGILLIAVAGYSGGHRPDPSEVSLLLVLLLPGAAVFTAGVLLRRADVRAWTAARGQGR